MSDRRISTIRDKQASLIDCWLISMFADRRIPVHSRFHLSPMMHSPIVHLCVSLLLLLFPPRGSRSIRIVLDHDRISHKLVRVEAGENNEGPGSSAWSLRVWVWVWVLMKLKNLYQPTLTHPPSFRTHFSPARLDVGSFLKYDSIIDDKKFFLSLSFVTKKIDIHARILYLFWLIISDNPRC